MHVTIVDSDLSFPANSGKRLRSLNLMLPLARHHRITYIARAADPAEEARADVFLRDHGITPIFVAEPLAAKVGAAFYARLAVNAVSPLPYSVALHVTPRMRAAVAEHTRRNPVDVLQLEHVNYMYCAEGVAAPVVVQAHNVESLVWKRLAETAPNPLARLYYASQERKYAAWERRSFHAVDRVVSCSAVDAELARTLYGNPPVTVVDNGVDPDYFRDVGREPGSRKVLFVGALDWRPNMDAVDQLLSEILPALRARVPDAEFMIVGRKPSAAMRSRIEATAGAVLHADVPDVRPFMAAAAAMAVPLRIGGGSRLKILEAMAARLPVVSSTIGAEGLELVDGRDLVIADTSKTMAAGLADAILSPDAARKRAEHGRTTVEHRYAWTNLAARLDQVWTEVADARRRLAS